MNERSRDKSAPFSGVIVAMNSCYDSKGRVNPEAVRELTRWLIGSGIGGLYIGGGTGEGMLQTAEERELVLEAVVAETGGAIPVIAHVGAITTEDSVRLAAHAEEAGADAISAVPPFYYAYSEEAVKRHWFAMMEAAKLPFLIYNVPAATGFTMTTAFLKELCAHPQLAGIKTTSFSTYELQQFKAAGGPSFMVFNGPDQQYLAGRVMGASGGIGGTYGAMPELFLRIEQAYLSSDIAEAQRWQFVVNEFITEIRAYGLFGTIKELVRLRGIDCGEPRAPLAPLSEQGKSQVRRLYERMIAEIERG
ncbi:N-acetylneuraminate lyase [Paenibacillus sp. UNCCL117]|uniref:dihydrodipicolinate synthase family protein n=1 Tax=unclassified Paenibacillus TaxID=185978 RepID=UPI00087ED6B3|nr:MULTISPECIES: dihydrodipicolinate synthase family protein [unclassified Paenibacillus]SDD90584.1 N-acetylneuraminate lyase [Paenibacillus sp. cl123]SFW43888.1 N-acetylneuraminate lyase [Paenibacillus sp. UNCCL117]